MDSVLKADGSRIALRRYVEDRDNHLCGIHREGCGLPLSGAVTTDHIIPKSYFTAAFPESKWRLFEKPWNRQPMHKACDEKKGGYLTGFPMFDCGCHFMLITTAAKLLTCCSTVGSEYKHITLLDDAIRLPNTSSIQLGVKVKVPNRWRGPIRMKEDVMVAMGFQKPPYRTIGGFHTISRDAADFRNMYVLQWGKQYGNLDRGMFPWPDYFQVLSDHIADAPDVPACFRGQGMSWKYDPGSWGKARIREYNLFHLDRGNPLTLSGWAFWAYHYADQSSFLESGAVLSFYDVLESAPSLPIQRHIYRLTPSAD